MDPWDPWGEEEEGSGIISRIITFIRNPVVWGTAIGVVVAAGVAVVVIIRRKSSKLPFDDN